MEASGNSNSFNHGDFSHYAVSKSSGDKIVISRKDPNFLDYITSFSYLFSFYGLLLLPLLFRMGSSGSSRRTLNLAMKIQIVLISLVFISLLAFGWGSGIFVSNQYNQYTNDVIREKLSSVETEVRAKLGNYDQLFIDVNGSMAQYYLQKFARVFFTDINLYDANGYLLATSRPKVFNQGLISEQMNPEAFKNMKYAQKSEFVHRENIGNLVYSSAYKPFYNNNGKKLAFINLQHFGQQSEFENQIQKFLVAIVNVFILLLAVSIILAIFISNWLTAPLRILQESFSSVRFGIHNEPILYNKQDEIGALVKDYNSKLEELEFTAQQLARSERESAWREMAKQVAHEIKNPLTPMKLSVQQLLRTYNPKDTKMEEKFQRVAASIIEQIEALTNIANEFSSFAKMPVPMESRIELTALIKSVVEVFSLEGHSDIELFCDEKIFINADKDQMIRVFNNLIKNATQAIPQHQEGQISIQIQRIENKVKIAVSDNGIGIEKSKWNKLFVPYFTTKSTGTGLGLAMVKQILESHQGVIDFETHPGEGTTFYVELPLADT
jgi:signal transduction histidine kinase